MLKKIIALATAVTVMVVGFAGCGTQNVVNTYTSDYDGIELPDTMETYCIESLDYMCADDETALELGKALILQDVDYPNQLTYDGERLTITMDGMSKDVNIPNGNGLYEIGDGFNCKITDDTITLMFETELGTLKIPYDIER